MQFFFREKQVRAKTDHENVPAGLPCEFYPARLILSPYLYLAIVRYSVFLVHAART